MKNNQKKFLTFGTHSLMTTLIVVAIFGVINFLAVQFPKRIDLTKNKIHTLSEQTKKIVRAIQDPIQVTAFVKGEQRESVRSLFANYQALNPKFSVEYVDPDREPFRASQAQVKGSMVIILTHGKKEARLDQVNEEKLTNELIKLTRSQATIICWLKGHGEKDPDGNTPEGYLAASRFLKQQFYEIQPVELITQGKVPEACHALVIAGPTRAFLPEETKLISEYIKTGGRAWISLDIGSSLSHSIDPSPEISKLIRDWSVSVEPALIIDPVSRVLNFEPTMPIIATFSKDHEISKELQGNSLFPLSRPLKILPQAPTTLKLHWLLKTTPNSWGETNLQSITQGSVSYQAKEDLKGPLDVAVAVQGKLTPDQTKESRLVIFGTSYFASNQYIRFGANADTFANSISWLVNDEELISIRKNTDAGGLIELSQTQGSWIFFLTVIIAPLLMVITGLVVWIRRKKL